MKFEVRVTSNVTLDFIIYAHDEEEAEDFAEGYVDYVDGGAIFSDGYPRQHIRMELPDEDKLTHCFFMDTEVCNVNEAE